MSGAIPISAARAMGQKHDCPIVVVFAVEEGGEQYCVTTWGRTKQLCGWAAKVGEDIHQAVMRGEILNTNHADDPYAKIERLQTRVDELTAIDSL